MNTVHILYHCARADVLERTRRYSFLMTIAATVYLGYLVSDGTIGIHMGQYHALMNSAWAGMMMTLCGVTFVSLVGFYVVKGTVEHDRRTGVGQILATTPIPKSLYLAAKTLGNFVVLIIVIIILALAAILILFWKHEDDLFNLWTLLSPFILIAIPAMFLVAAVAVCFETVSFLRHGIGNVIFFFLWTAVLVIPIGIGSLPADVIGLKMPMEQIQSDLRSIATEYTGQFSIGTARAEPTATTAFRWNGMTWTAERLGYRMLPVGYALVLLLLASLLFDRFDTAPASRTRTSRIRWLRSALGSTAWQKLPDLTLRPFIWILQRSLWGRVLLAELRLMVQGQPAWWYVIATGLWTASIVVDPQDARADVLPWLWIWPLFLWSAMGTRENLFRTEEILFSSPHPVGRQVPALWAAGVLVSLGAASGIMARLALAGSYAPLLSVSVGALFIPSLALTLGIWSSSSKMFEAVYTVLWYIGPIHHAARLDFMATTDNVFTAGSPGVFMAVSVVLVAGALAGRKRQIARG